MKRPGKIDDWFYMAMKELRRDSYYDMLENWDITEEQADEIEKYIEEKLGVEL